MNWAFVIRSLCKIRSFRRTVIFTVVILVQLWLALPLMFRHAISELWPEKYEIVLPEDYQPPLLPIVIFSSYKPRPLEKTLKSMSNSGNVQPTTPCLFVLHQTKRSSMDDINDTYKVLAKITFCRKLVWTYGNDKEQTSTDVLKAHWWKVMTKVFEEKDTFQLKSNESFKGDVFFIEDDAILSPDFMEVLWYSLYVKNSVPDTWFSTLQGMGSENLVEHHPDTFAVSQVPVIESICYAFNVSTWHYIKKTEKAVVGYTERDWPIALGLLLFYDHNETVQIVTPTISRIWHVSGNNKERIPPWKRASEKRFLNHHKAKVIPGIRDMYGQLCHPCELEARPNRFPRQRFQCRCFCPLSNAKTYWNWQIAAFAKTTKRMMHCQLVSHLMIMLAFIILGCLIFGYLL